MTHYTDEQEKSLKLAEMMGWKPNLRGNFNGAYPSHEVTEGLFDGSWLRMYPDSRDTLTDVKEGLAQFAAILLKFPEVMNTYTDYENDCDGSVDHIWRFNEFDYPPTQANILDEILRMNGVDV